VAFVVLLKNAVDAQDLLIESAESFDFLAVLSAQFLLTKSVFLPYRQDPAPFLGNRNAALVLFVRLT